MSFLASGESFLGGEAGKRVTGPAPDKSQMKDCLESPLYRERSFKENSRKRFAASFSRELSVELLDNVSSKITLGSSWLVRCENENCPSQIMNSN